jgi:phage baseplate assembly protein W
MSGRHMKFPFRIAADGRSASPENLDEHVKGEIIQLLLTNPGERPFLPDFGGGVRRLVFEGNDEVTRGMAKAVISQSISYWLQQRIRLLAINVDSDDSILKVDVSYQVVASGEEKQIRFQHEA